MSLLGLQVANASCTASAKDQHLSTDILVAQVEEGTPFARWYAGGSSSSLPLEPDAVAMFEMASHMLAQAGYEHYEVHQCLPCVNVYTETTVEELMCHYDARFCSKTAVLVSISAGPFLLQGAMYNSWKASAVRPRTQQQWMAPCCCHTIASHKIIHVELAQLYCFLTLQISNYAKPGHRSRHNQVYWNCQQYYAFGLGAASCVQVRGM